LSVLRRRFEPFTSKKGVFHNIQSDPCQKNFCIALNRETASQSDLNKYTLFYAAHAQPSIVYLQVY